jgi:acyl dehydratase
MPLNRDFVGREYPASDTYEVSRELIRRFADAIGDTNPAYTDVEAAQALGHPDVIAPPTFLTTLVEVEPRFVHHRPVHAGDVLTVTSSVTEIRDAGGNEVMTMKTAVTDSSGAPVNDQYSTLVSRGTAAPKEG